MAAAMVLMLLLITLNTPGCYLAKVMRGEGVRLLLVWTRNL
jgi:hypothetical protein